MHVRRSVEYIYVLRPALGFTLLDPWAICKLAHVRSGSLDNSGGAAGTILWRERLHTIINKHMYVRTCSQFRSPRFPRWELFVEQLSWVYFR
eukprot:6691139-Pyramimonas_sp.AAC.1